MIGKRALVCLLDFFIASTHRPVSHPSKLIFLPSFSTIQDGGDFQRNQIFLRGPLFLLYLFVLCIKSSEFLSDRLTDILVQNTTELNSNSLDFESDSCFTSFLSRWSMLRAINVRYFYPAASMHPLGPHQFYLFVAWLDIDGKYMPLG